MLHLGGQQHADCREADNVMLWEVEYSNGINIPVENGRGYEEALGLVLLLLVQVKDLLDAV